MSDAPGDCITESAGHCAACANRGRKQIEHRCADRCPDRQNKPVPFPKAPVFSSWQWPQTTPTPAVLIGYAPAFDYAPKPPLLFDFPATNW